jgi:hypothetical protein
MMTISCKTQVLKYSREDLYKVNKIFNKRSDEVLKEDYHLALADWKQYFIPDYN